MPLAVTLSDRQKQVVRLLLGVSKVALLPRVALKHRRFTVDRGDSFRLIIIPNMKSNLGELAHRAATLPYAIGGPADEQRTEDRDNQGRCQ